MKLQSQLDFLQIFQAVNKSGRSPCTFSCRFIGSKNDKLRILLFYHFSDMYMYTRTCVV